MRSHARLGGRRCAVLISVVLVGLGVLVPPAGATTDFTVAPPSDSDSVDQPVVTSSSIPAERRRETLGPDWRESSDRAVVTSGDATGFHVLAADGSDGYAWHTVASLSEPGVETDQWVGNMCVTASGRRAVVVYAPRHFTNRDYLADRGGFVAVVDLVSGSVRKLGVTTSLAYFNPGCGAGETAVLTQGGGEDLHKTRLHVLDAATGWLGAPIVVDGQVTSPLPTGSGVVAAAYNGVVAVAPSGKTTVLAKTAGVPYRMAADRDGGITFLESSDNRLARARRLKLDTGSVSTLATGKIGDLGVTAAAGGAVYVTGKADRAADAQVPGSVHIGGAARDVHISGADGIAVSSVTPASRRDPKLAPASMTEELPVDITATALATGQEFTLTVVPTALGGDGARQSPALAGTTLAGDPTDPRDETSRTCAVPRNDPRNQPVQPKPRQVEWAVNQLVTNSLNVTRPANWMQFDMPSYSVSNWFPQAALNGGGQVPAQVLLGIALAESNLSQAAWYAVPGVTSNPLIGNYYGVDDRSGDVSEWLIDFQEADCGYGVMQITDGMRKAGTERPTDAPALPVDKQRAIALDFVANISQGQRILASKWNTTHADGMLLNGGNSGYLENWFYALWAYNSGYYPEANAGENLGAWGVGWFNNPINPRYDRGRGPFMKNPNDGRTPQLWPYPEKVLGYAGYPVHLIESPGVMVPAFRPAGWNSQDFKDQVKPPVDLFCDDTNYCYPDHTGPEPCGRIDFKCWYHEPTAWKPGCVPDCGMQYIRFDPGYAYQEDGTAYQPNCGFGQLPANARIIDNIPSTVPSIRPNCSMALTDAGTFRFDFAADSTGHHRGKIDTHQIGSGFRGHFWMSNTNQSPTMRVTGTWTWSAPAGWARVLVHLPIVGARTQQARYEIDVDGSGTYSRYRYLNQEIQRNGWVSLGVYQFSGTPSVRLSNITDDGMGTERVAWDAVALQPLTQKPRHIVAALGDSYSSGEGASSYFAESDSNHGTHRWNACRRSASAWPRKVVLPGTSVSLGTLADGFDANHELGFVACSGAKSWNVTGLNEDDQQVQPVSWNQPEDYEQGEGQFHEISQINSGVLDANTTLVTLSLGGNDEGAFQNAVTECAGVGSCASDTTFLPRYKTINDRTKTRLTKVLSLIHAKAPNAKIVLLSYPELLSRTATCAGVPTFGLPESQALAELAGDIATKQRDVTEMLRAAGAPIYAGNVINDFAGHGGCDPVEWIHKLRVGANGEGDFHLGDAPSPFCLGFTTDECLSRETFHPNANGATAYAVVLRRTLDEIGYS